MRELALLFAQLSAAARRGPATVSTGSCGLLPDESVFRDAADADADADADNTNNNGEERATVGRSAIERQ